MKQKLEAKMVFQIKKQFKVIAEPHKAPWEEQKADSCSNYKYCSYSSHDFKKLLKGFKKKNSEFFHQMELFSLSKQNTH